MMPLPLFLLGLQTPDAVPALKAVKVCDREQMRAIARAEPRRRTEFAAAVYAERQAIASERVRLLSLPPSGEASASGQATAALALGQLDAREKQIDDTTAVERSWRDLYDEVRADYLANCTGGKRDKE